MKVYSQTIHVTAAQTDLNARMKPSAILEIMQEAAGAHAEIIGVGRNALMSLGMVWVITRAEVQMDRYPVFGEAIRIETFPQPNRRWFFPRCFTFHDEAGNPIGRAATLWVLLDVSSRKMCKPDAIASLMPDNSDLTPPMGMPSTVYEPVATPVTDMYFPRYTDMDMNKHVNNTKYIDWCCNALGIDVMQKHELSSFSLNYHQEIRPGQQIRTELRQDGPIFSFSGFEGSIRHFDAGGTLRPIENLPEDTSCLESLA